MKDKDLERAVFWASLLQPVVLGEVSPEETAKFLRELAREERLFPDGRRRKASLSTLRRKLQIYREQGFEALGRKRRSDRGKPRAHSRELLEKATELKRDQPLRSHLTINKFLEVQHGKTIPKSTLYRHLKEAGATRLKLGVEKKKVRRRWTRDSTHALWLGDFEDGPYVLHDGQVVPTYLSAFIDCYSRALIEGRYYLRHNLDVLIDSLLRAWAIHGASSELYVDQAKVYLSRALKAATLALDIRLIHRGKGDPPPGGLIERFFETAQSQFEAEVRAGDILTFDDLNRAFDAWRTVGYQRQIHTETGETPEERFQRGLTQPIRHVDIQRVSEFFLRRERRRVHPDFSDVQLYRRFYRVPKDLRSDRVEVRYDPFSSPDTVLIYSLSEEYLAKGVLHNRERGDDISPPAPLRKPQHNYIELLCREHEEELRRRSRGIDYRKAVASRQWPFLDFAAVFARLLGRKGGLASFNTHELEELKKFYNRTPALSEHLLREAFEASREKTIPYIAFELQRLAGRKET
jgi:transposase InsO family protein